MTTPPRLIALGSCWLALAVLGCGSSGSNGAAHGSAGSSSASSSAGAAGALSAETRSAATGDIPDNQVFLVYTNPAPGYSIKYPEGWTVSGAGASVTFRDKNNIVHILDTAAAPPTAASVAHGLGELKSTAIPSLTFTAPVSTRLGNMPAIKATYTTRSAPDPVTGRSVELIVDRYALYHGGRVAIVDLGTPRGVDNVDAYRMMIASFRFR